MGLRETLQQNSMAATVGAIVVLVIALGVVAMQFREPSVPDVNGYWYDLQTDEVFTAELGQDPPIDAPSGGDGARAHLFSCGACSPEEWFGYLEIFGDEYVRARQDGTLEEMDQMERLQFLQNQHKVRPLEGGNWVPRNGRAGQQLIENIRNRCNSGEAAVTCEP